MEFFVGTSHPTPLVSAAISDMSNLPYPFDGFAFDTSWVMAPGASHIPHPIPITSALSGPPFPLSLYELNPAAENNVPQRVPDTRPPYTAMGLDSLLRDPPPRISRLARRRLMGGYSREEAGCQTGFLYGRRATRNTHKSAQYHLGTEPRRNVDVPPARPPHWAQSMANEVQSRPGRLHESTHRTQCAPEHNLPEPPHVPTAVTHHLPASCASIDDQRYNPGLRAEALQLQLIPPGRMAQTMVSTGMQSVPTAGMASAAEANHDSDVHPNTRHRDAIVMIASWGCPNLTAIAEPSSGRDDMSPRQDDEVAQQPEFPSFTGRQPPGGACAGCAEAGKKCDGVTGSGIACE
ncbi:hypothetical protein OBBRIDRAFT_663948 [Obba rivulosa]|uniref:Uncharacterized protein n=1 Tax=Obba rivulosa TaxID=1052685 RepID=A0A8E2AWK7_9APHY|nr:hypothetical protein OBBRIDRAFT_663948 [Obba rivulosa]